MKKNLLCLVSNIRAVALCLAVVCSTIASWATPAKGNTFTIGDLKYTVTSVDPYECSVNGANENITEAQISETVSYDGVNLKVTSIGDGAFDQYMYLSSVTIPNSVTSIGEYAFKNCIALSSITIPEGVTSIGVQAFYYCKSLSSVTIPNSVTSIGRYTFAGCSELTDITIPESVISIGRYTFAGCSKLTDITIPNSVTSISRWAFYGCTSLSSVTIPKSVTSIGGGAFVSCPLTQVTCKGTTPPECASDAFYEVDLANCKLIVPKSSVDSYKSASIWSTFGDISTLVKKINIEYNDGTATLSIDRLNVKKLTFTEE